MISPATILLYVELAGKIVPVLRIAAEEFEELVNRARAENEQLERNREQLLRVRERAAAVSAPSGVPSGENR